MKNIQKFEDYDYINDQVHFSEKDPKPKIDEETQLLTVTLKQAQSIVNFYKNGPLWNEVLTSLNDKDINYKDWDDFDVIIWYLEN